MSGRLPFVVACLWGRLATAGALQPGGGEIEGIVIDDAGHAVGGADVVATACEGSARRVTVTDARGQFTLTVAAPALLDLAVIRRHGASVIARVLRVGPGDRVVLRVQGDEFVRSSGGSTAVHDGSQLPSVRWDGVPLFADGTLAGYVSNSVGARAAGTGAGPGIAGLGPDEVRVTLDGMRLDDPIDGRVPWDLPFWIFGVANMGDDGGATGGLGRAVVRLSSATAEPKSSGVIAAQRRAGETQLTGTAGRCAAAVTVRVGAAAVQETSGHERWQGPVLARGHVEIGEWEIAGVGLVHQGQTRFARSGPIEPASQPATLTQRLVVATAEARRGWAGSSAEFLATAGHVRGRRDVQTRQGGVPLKMQSERSHVGVEFSAGGQAAGRHRLRLGAQVDATSGFWRVREMRPALPQKFDEPMRARGYELAAGADERWRMFRFAEVEFGVRAEKRWLRNQTDGGGIETDPLLMPRMHLRVWDESTALQASVTAARFAGPAPLSWMQPGDQPTDVALAAPVEDLVAAALSWEPTGLRLGVDGFATRSAHVVEDRLDLTARRRIVENQSDARRLYRGIRFQAEGHGAGLRFGGAYLLSRLWGNYAGPLQATPDYLDRTHDLRVWAAAVKQVRGFEVRVGVVGRLQSGAARMVDGGVGLARALGRTVIWGALEGFNVTGSAAAGTDPVSLRLVVGIEL